MTIPTEIFIDSEGLVFFWGFMLISHFSSLYSAN